MPSPVPPRSRPRPRRRSDSSYLPIVDVIDERSFVNAIVGLLATGGSTNHTLHLVAMAHAAGIHHQLG